MRGSPKGSIGKVVDAKIKAGRPHGGGAATQVQNRQAKERKEQIKETARQAAQDRADILRAKLLSFNGPPNAGKAKKFNENAKRKGQERRLKAELRKAERKARRR